MDIVRGTDASVNLFTETSYGNLTDYTHGQKLFIVSENVKTNQQTSDSNTITGLRNRLKPAFGNINVNGSINVEVNPENMMGLLYYALGDWNTPAAVAGVYTHTFKSGGNGNALPSFQMEVDFGPGSPSDQRFHIFKGLKVSGFNIQIPNSGYVTAGFDIVGQDSTMSGNSADSSGAYSTKLTQYQGFEATVSIDGSTAAMIENMTINGSNDLDESVYVIGTNGKRSELPAGFCTVSGQFSAFFNDNSTLLNAINTKKEVSIIVTLTHNTGPSTAAVGTVGKETMKFTITRALLDRTSPEINGPGGVKMSLSFKGYTLPSDGTTIESSLIVEIKNAVASYLTVPV